MGAEQRIASEGAADVESGTRSSAPDDEETLRALLAPTAYRFVRVLGRGGMGTVIEAEHTALGKSVVVKVLKDELGPRPELAARLRSEARTLARLEHPNVVAVTDLVETPGGVCVVMERLRGRNVHELLRDRVRLTWQESVQIVEQAAAGVGAAHAAGIVHRDIKPENLFVCERDDGSLHVKVLDFGIAKPIGGPALEALRGGAAQSPAFQTRGWLGTPAYAAPEQLEGRPVSPATDVHALGLTLHELVTGSHPFRDRNGKIDFERMRIELPPPVSSLAPGAPPALDAIVLRALAKRPSDRFDDARELAEALGAVRRAAPAPVPAPLPARPASRHEQDTLPSPIRARAPASAPAARRWKDELRALGIAALVSSLVGVLVRGALFLQAIVWIRSPTSALAAPPSAADARRLEELVSVAAPFEIVRQSVLLLAALALGWIALDALRQRARAVRRLRAWTGVVLAALAAALAVDLLVSLPLQSLYAQIGAGGVGEPVRGMLTELGAAWLIAAAIVQAPIPIAFRVWAARLARRLPRGEAA